MTLKIRLFALSAISIFFALLLAGFAIGTLFEKHVEANLTKDLSDQFDRLVVLLDPQISVPTLSAPLANPSFSVPYGGFYWQITNTHTNERTRSRSMWDVEFNLTDEKLMDGRQHRISLPDPEGTPAIALVQRVQFEQTDSSFNTFDIIVAEDLRLTQEAVDSFRLELFRSLAILAIALAIAAWVQISLGLAPFARIKSEINAIRTGLTKRMQHNHPPEVMPLINEVNGLLEVQEKSINFARTRASNLAHALKTHLTVLQSQAEELRAIGQHSKADEIEKLGNDMHEIVDHQLRLSRLRTRSANDYHASPLKTIISKICTTLQKSPAAKSKHFDIDIPETILVNIDTPDLYELAGIVMENALTWAKSTILISAISQDSQIILTIQDDGPGLSPSQTKKLGQRGIRLDQKGAGTGIGLSIACEIIALNSGKITFSSPPDQGLLVKICLPASQNIPQKTFPPKNTPH